MAGTVAGTEKQKEQGDGWDKFGAVNDIAGVGAGGMAAANSIMGMTMDEKDPRLEGMGTATGISDTLSGGMGAVASGKDLYDAIKGKDKDKWDVIGAGSGMLGSLAGMGGGIAGLAGADDKVTSGFGIAGGALGAISSGIGLRSAFGKKGTTADKVGGIAGLVGSLAGMGSGIAGLFGDSKAGKIAGGVLGAISGIAGMIGGIANRFKKDNDSNGETTEKKEAAAATPTDTAAAAKPTDAADVVKEALEKQ